MMDERVLDMTWGFELLENGGKLAVRSSGTGKWDASKEAVCEFLALRENRFAPTPMLDALAK